MSAICTVKKNSLHIIYMILNFVWHTCIHLYITVTWLLKTWQYQMNSPHVSKMQNWIRVIKSFNIGHDDPIVWIKAYIL